MHDNTRSTCCAGTRFDVQRGPDVVAVDLIAPCGPYHTVQHRMVDGHWIDAQNPIEVGQLRCLAQNVDTDFQTSPTSSAANVARRSTHRVDASVGVIPASTSASVYTSIPRSTHFHTLLSQLAEGDLLFYGEISAALAQVPSRIQTGDVYVTPLTSQLVWYEVLGDECEGQVLVRAYSRSLKQGEYDYVAPGHLAARVTRRLFERARVQGFRTVRAFN